MIGLAARPAVHSAALVNLGWDRPLAWLAAGLVALGVGYGLGMLGLSRRSPRYGTAGPAIAQAAALLLPRIAVPSAPGTSTPAPASGAATTNGGPDATRGGEFYLFLMPCLNEELVIARSLQRLLSMPAENFAVMVVDDGSDDGTAAAVTGVADERVWLLSRKLPNARQGKGAALNDAIAQLVSSDRLAGRDPDKVIIAVVDADGHLDPHALADVTEFFADPAVGAVQIGVRIDNRDRSTLARMQDMEFVIYTEVFQRGRRHLGSVGLGGNGQFVRLSALRSLRPAPWTRSLTEDLDLGVRLAAAGWRNEYCRTAAVHQQGVVEVKRLVRQRARWFQGNLQSWRLIPLVLRSMPARKGADLLFLLSSPALVLIASLLTVSFCVVLANCAVLAAAGHDPFGSWVAVTYVLILGPALAYAGVYWKKERATGLGLVKAFWLAHLYVGYSMIWYAAGGRAAVRAMRGRTGWAKTDRVAEGPTATPAPAAILISTAAPAPIASTVGTAPATTIPSPAAPASPAATNAVTADATAAPVPVTRPSPAPAKVPNRRRVVLAVTAAVLACATAATVVMLAGLGTHGRTPRPWRVAFTGHGQVTGITQGRAIVLAPEQATAPGITHAALVVSAQRYRDFTATVTVRTLRQLRHGTAGAPHPWEVGWVVWHYTSNRSFYALTLEQHGWVLSKQDPAYRGDERFLASGRTPGFPVGRPHQVQITQAGPTITVHADGHLLTRFTDTLRPYLTGSLGLYCEDSLAQFEAVHIRDRT
jgi:1,2-diacylglycerol 3-beta-glucosyltransferase